MLPAPVSFAFQDSFIYVHVCFGCATARVHREGTGSPGAGITGHNGLPGVGAGNKLQFSLRKTKLGGVDTPLIPALGRQKQVDL